MPTPTLAFRAPAGRHAEVVKARAGDHVVVQVLASTAGEASIPELGMTGNAEPGTPATFDLIVPQAGHYAVMFGPPSGTASTIGTLVATG